MANEQIQRYEMVSLTRCGDAWQELKADDEGDWVSYDDHLAATNDLREGQMHLAMELERKDEQIRKLREQVARLSAPVSELKRSAWFDDFRPFINAIGEISVQEAMDAIERDLK